MKPPWILNSKPELRAEILGLLQRLFSIRGRWMFPLLVAALSLLSVGAWWSVKSAIEGDIRSRLESEADRVDATIRGRMNTFANTLFHMRSDFLVLGVPSPERFHDFIASLDAPQRFTGLRSFGYAPINISNDIAKAKTTLLEPLGAETQAYAPPANLDGADLLTDRQQRSAIVESARTGEPVLTAPFANGNEAGSEAGFSLFLAYRRAAKPSIKPAELKDIDGALFANFRANDFFEGIFGAPSLKKEAVNFSLETPAPSRAVFYNRFDLAEAQLDRSFSLARPVKILGQDLLLRITPLSHFFKPSDMYLPPLVGFGAAFISILILLVLKSSQTQLLFETHAKDVSVLAAKRSRTQNELLNRLNEYARDLATELDLGKIVQRIATLAPKILRAEESLFYCALEDGVHAPVLLLGQSGIDVLHLRHRSLTLQETHSLLPNRFLMVKADRDSAATFKELFNGSDEFADWILVGIPSRDTGRCGLLFLGRNTKFEPLEIEVIESFISQAAGSMENARLFRKVEEASRAKNAFLANMSHEIRTPLNAIIGYSEILLKDPTTTQKATLAHNIRRGSHQLTRIIDDILDLSKIEAGNLAIDRQRVRLSALIQEVRSGIEAQADEKHIQFTVENTGLIPSHVTTDELRLKQILGILLGNAIKFTEKGHVNLSVRCHEEESGETSVIFRVRDTGVGIEPEAQHRLFEVFSQADDSKTRRFGGSGMGLALSRRLCEELGGGLTLIESFPGEGSSFEARVNAGRLQDATWSDDINFVAPVEVSESLKIRTGRLTNTNILLVEDSVDNQEIFRFFLEGAGAHVEVAENGLDAVKFAALTNYDLVLMDIQIPEIDGKEATRRIRHHGYKKPIVALTAHALLEERVSCIEAGCDGQITKPVSGDNLINEVYGYLRRINGRVPNHLERNESPVPGASPS